MEYACRKERPATVLLHLVLWKDAEVVATGGIRWQANILYAHQHLSELNPWLAVLYTKEGHRNQGLGSMLLEALESCAKDEGLSKIYLYTFTAESLYNRCVWKVTTRVWYKDHDTAVMEKEL